MSKQKARSECNKCGAKVKWLQGALDEWFLIDLPGMTLHTCIEKVISPIEKMVAAKKNSESTLPWNPDIRLGLREQTPPIKTEIKKVEDKVKVSYTEQITEVNEKLDILIDLLIKVLSRERKH